MKTKQAVNPYMPSWEYVPDAEPHVVGDRVYVYGSHDIFNGLNFCLGDYVCWSAPIDDLGNWRYEGCIYKREQDPAAPRIRLTNGLAAPDMVQGSDGRFYLYYFMGGTKMISVAVCDEPAGKYEFYGYVKYSDGVAIGKKNEPFQFDPGIFMDDDGKLYLYTGFALAGNPILLDGSKPTEHGPMCFELDPSDMLTVLNGPSYIGIAGEKESVGTPYEGHSFLEASSMRKFDGTYYFIYSTMNSHELCYATSDSPVKGFQYGGRFLHSLVKFLHIAETTSNDPAIMSFFMDSKNRCPIVDPVFSGNLRCPLGDSCIIAAIPDKGNTSPLICFKKFSDLLFADSISVPRYSHTIIDTIHQHM